MLSLLLASRSFLEAHSPILLGMPACIPIPASPIAKVLLSSLWQCLHVSRLSFKCLMFKCLICPWLLQSLIMSVVGSA